MCGALRVLSAGSAATEGPRRSRSTATATATATAASPPLHHRAIVPPRAGAIVQPSPRRGEARCDWVRSEEHTSELQSLMRISYAVFCLKKKKFKDQITN